jgi:hypothetical protein
MDEHDNLREALFAFQAECGNVMSDTVVQSDEGRAYQYPKLPAAIDALKPVAAKHNLHVKMKPVFDAGEAGISCEVVFVPSGEVEDYGILPMPYVQDNPRSRAAAITYARRVMWMIVSNTAAEDDDALECLPQTTRRPEPETYVADQRRERRPVSKPPIKDWRAKKIKTFANKAWGDESKTKLTAELTALGVKTVEQLTEEQAQPLYHRLSKLADETS